MLSMLKKLNTIWIFFLFFMLIYIIPPKIIALEQDNIENQQTQIPEYILQQRSQTSTQEEVSNISTNFLRTLFGLKPSKDTSLKIQDTSSNSPKMYNNFVYYPQIGGDYDNILLPNGSTLKEAGCGPTTVAMILSTYVDKQYTPSAVVDIYKQKEYYLGTEGSNYRDAKTIFESFGLKTTAIQYYNDTRIDEIATELKNYLRNGWTFFVQGNYQCNANPNGCAHYFWIIDIDEKNNVMSLDSYYGRLQVPFNQNKYYPFPKYQIVFGVKKI